jgi:protein-tyrosine phosphatase
MTKKNSLLFICTANRYRSPFAEIVFVNQLSQAGIAGEWDVGSAGTWTKNGLRAMPHAAERAQALGLELSGHRSREINEELLLTHDAVIVMETGHKEALLAEFPLARERIFLLSEIVEGVAYSLPDPASNPQDADQIMDELYALLERGFEKIVATVENQNR